ncbi:MAG: GMC oxidoreductase [Phycisphaerales bacterium]|nr:GMC oxidoreductase [Phycisphaerales bacterium]
MNAVTMTDLESAGESLGNVECDVAIVGAGAAGIYLARQLAAGGKDVVLLEAGSDVCASNAEVGFDVDFPDEPYPGATRGRFFGLGGTTSRWGGLLFPHTSLDALPDADFRPDQWPRIIDDVERWGPTVLRGLGFPIEGDFLGFASSALKPVSASLISAGLVPGASLFIPFRRRNFSSLLKAQLGANQRLRVLTNAIVHDWSMDESSQAQTSLSSLQAKSPSGRTVNVQAKSFVIAAGAIESTRLLLELDQCGARPVIRASSAVGAYMSDHLSHPVADTRPGDVDRAIRIFAPKFSKGWMRSMRFIESNPPPGSVRAFGHLVFEYASSGFNVVREVLSGLQRRRLPRLSLGDVFSGVTGACALAWGRYVRSELHVAKGTASRLQLDTEQIPLKSNRIELGDELDRHGRRNPVIHWRITDEDLANMTATGHRMIETWNRASIDLPRLIPREEDWDSSRPYDTFHPVGTCRMGEDDEAVVTPDLQVHGVDNLWVTSTAVLPTAGTANPGYTLLCMAHGLGQRMLER